MDVRARDPACGGSVEGGPLTRSGVRKGIMGDLMSGLVLEGICQVERGETAAQSWRVAIAEVQPGGRGLFGRGVHKQECGRQRQVAFCLV